MVDDKLWEKFKIKAIKQKKSFSELVEKTIKKELRS